MSHTVKSFAELSWQAVALETIAIPDVSPQLLAPSLRRPSPGTAVLLAQAMKLRGDFLAQIGAWHHGGINE
jgi:hypothetical protein